MMALKWLILIALVSTVALWTYRFTPLFDDDWIRIYSRVPKTEGRLLIAAPPQSGDPLSIQIHLFGDAAETAKVFFENTPIETSVRPTDTGAIHEATVTATDGRNRIKVTRSTKPETPLVWIIGRPLN